MTFCKFSHSEKALLSIIVTVSGIVISVSPSHSANKKFDISVVPSSKVTLLRFEHLKNAPLVEPKKVTSFKLLGISIEVNAVQ